MKLNDLAELFEHIFGMLDDDQVRTICRTVIISRLVTPAVTGVVCGTVLAVVWKAVEVVQ